MNIIQGFSIVQDMMDDLTDALSTLDAVMDDYANDEYESQEVQDALDAVDMLGEAFEYVAPSSAREVITSINEWCEHWEFAPILECAYCFNSKFD